MAMISPRLGAQIVKELLSIFRDRRATIILVVPPLMQLFIFSFAATLEVRNANLAVVNHDSGRWSYELMMRLQSAEFIDKIVPVASEAAIADMINDQKVVSGVIIPETFSADLAAGRPAQVQMLVDGRRANAGQISQGYIDQIVQSVGREARGTVNASNVSEVRNWFNPNLNFKWFIVPSLAGILTTLTAIIVTSLSIARERELGTFDQLLVSPTTSSEIIISKSVPPILISSVQGAAMVILGMLIFNVPFTGSFPLLMFALTLNASSVVGIGLMLSAISSTQQQAILGAFGIAVPLVLLSGFATPTENMPLVLQWVSQAIPLTHILIILQGSFVKALPVPDVLAHIWPIVTITVITMTAATFFVRSKLQ